MKKISILIVLLVAFSSVTLAKKEIDLATEWGTAGFTATYDASTYTITYPDASWGGRGVWLGDYPGTDYSAYSSVVVVFTSDAEGTFQLVVEGYEDESSTTNISIASIKGSGDGTAYQMIQADLGSAATNLRQIYLQSSVAGTVTMVSATLYEPGEEVEILDLVLPLSRFTDGTKNSDGSYSFTGTKTYGWFNLWYGDDSGSNGTPADWSDYTFLMAEVAEGSDPVQITIEYADDLREQASGEAGETICLALNETYKSSVNQVAVQFQEGYGTHTAIIKKIYLTNTLADKVIDITNWYLWYEPAGAFVVVNVDDEGVAEFLCSYDWGWFYNYFGGLDCSNYNYYVVEFAEPTPVPVMLGVEYTNDEDGSWQSFDTGTTKACIELSDEYKNSVKQVVLQNGNNNDEGATFYVSNAYFSVENQSDEMSIILSDWKLWNTETSQNEDVTVTDGVAEFLCSYDWGWFYNYLGDVDCSEYGYYVVEFSEPTTYTVQLGVQYNNDENGTWESFPAGTTVACVALSADYMDSVKQVVLLNGNGSAGVPFYVSKTYFSANDVTAEDDDDSDSTDVQTLELDLANFSDAVDLGDGTYSFTGANQWAWMNLWLGADWSDYTYLVTEVAEGSATAQIVIEYAEISDQHQTQQGDAGSTIIMTLNDTYKSNVNQVAVQNVAEGDVIILSKMYLTNTLPTATNIATVPTAKESTSDVIYNLAGQRVTSSYKGLVIKNGKKVIVK